MFENGHSSQEVATELGLSRWEAQSLANEFRKKVMNSVTPHQLDDILRAFSARDYGFDIGDLLDATNLPESTLRVIEQEYSNGSFVSVRVHAPYGAGGEVNHYEWVPPLSLDQAVQATSLLEHGENLQEVAGQLRHPEQAIARLLEDADIPVLAPVDDAIAPRAATPGPVTGVLSDSDKADIRNLANHDGLSVSFLALLFNRSEDEIWTIVK
jgi:hypothetical protein